jgi:hypothetical protein
VFGDELCGVVVELGEEAFSPVAVLVEEEEEVFEVDFVGRDAVGQVAVHEAEGEELLRGD